MNLQRFTPSKLQVLGAVSAACLLAGGASAGVFISGNHHGEHHRHGFIGGIGRGGAGFIQHKGHHYQAAGIGRNGGVYATKGNLKNGKFQSYRRLPDGETIQRHGHYNKNGRYVVNSQVCDPSGHCHDSKWKP